MRAGEVFEQPEDGDLRIAVKRITIAPDWRDDDAEPKDITTLVVERWEEDTVDPKEDRWVFVNTLAEFSKHDSTKRIAFVTDKARAALNKMSKEAA